MTPKDLKDLIKLLKKADKNIAKISALRDTLRAQVYEMEVILDTLDEGVEQYGTGRMYMQDALDTISQYL